VAYPHEKGCQNKADPVIGLVNGSSQGIDNSLVKHSVSFQDSEGQKDGIETENPCHHEEKAHLPQKGAPDLLPGETGKKIIDHRHDDRHDSTDEVDMGMGQRIHEMAGLPGHMNPVSYSGSRLEKALHRPNEKAKDTEKNKSQAQPISGAAGRSGEWLVVHTHL
jgi:hypothetical protein